jgi:hypothetical protein
VPGAFEEPVLTAVRLHPSGASAGSAPVAKAASGSVARNWALLTFLWAPPRSSSAG